MPLKVENLKISTKDGKITPVKNAFLTVEKGERVALVGESGSGKSLTALSILKLLPENLIAEGNITVDDKNVFKLTGEKLRQFRWKDVSMIFQDPSASLNPLIKVGEQVGEAIKFHHPELSKKEITEKVIELFKIADIPEPHKRINAYPHHLSGGLKQRVCIAMALACNPKYVIADEPTTALDVTVQGKILELLKKISERNNVGILLITHDMGVVAEFAKKIYVMYAGYTVEHGTVEEVFSNPLHPYTEGLLKCSPTLSGKPKRKLPSIPGSIPQPNEKISGCPFHPRCPIKKEICEREFPPAKWKNGRFVLCHLR
ncbi:peptide/nickel transport system ATP-binding protein/oligopeptide transport system ATP-binding protein [Desulfurobacterium pacificum]|uniref:Peptide/nickel transport system ATP-binding protein/oligopeptide transport system ATP-binding protein n=1 Tax=Desulfurobacterium pacificum TaxID=240166 RepID=A0ABY1NG25_9BACT|nr:ABC transporter ATP-binding protein [Desulfurobacterium pacificum]SMP08849.1 peptide/nickel transport system ATP-binding protein/oligopeptide transport system ATP-binding protein [Desulfurobacterium pacificum]